MANPQNPNTNNGGNPDTRRDTGRDNSVESPGGGTGREDEGEELEGGEEE
jgi:hypothetical protein